MAQVAAGVLALPMDRIRVVPPERSIHLSDQASSRSRSTTMVGRAVQEAAQDVVDQLRKIAAEMLGKPAAPLTVLDGAVVSGAQRLAYPDLLDHHFSMRGGELIGRGVVAPGRTKAALGRSTPFWEVAMRGAEITLDEETGAIAIEAYASISDVGRCINPEQCEAHDDGAGMHELGHPLLGGRGY